MSIKVKILKNILYPLKVNNYLKMKLLILSLILIISQVNCDEQIKEKIVEYKKLLCENPLTDKQVVDIKNNCMANRHPKVSFVKFFS